MEVKVTGKKIIAKWKKVDWYVYLTIENPKNLKYVTPIYKNPIKFKYTDKIVIIEEILGKNISGVLKNDMMSPNLKTSGMIGEWVNPMNGQLTLILS